MKEVGKMVNIKKFSIIGLIILVLNLTACSKNIYREYSDETFVLGTFVNITIYSDKKVNDEIFEALFDRLYEIESLMTVNREGSSEVENINERAGKSFVEVSKDTLYVIEEGVKYTHLTNDRFDITIGPLVKLWDIGFEGKSVPDQQDIESALRVVDIDAVDIDAENLSVKLDEGMRLDLGGIAKGYAADQIALMIREYGYESAIINLGGNILTLGSKPNDQSYKIGIRDPFKSSSTHLGIVSITDKSLVTSGVYERNFIEDDKLYHHILDTDTGYPVENELESVSIISNQSIEADALSTGVFAMGLEEGYEFIETLKDIEAIFVTSDKKVYITSGAKDMFIITDKNFKLFEL